MSKSADRPVSFLRNIPNFKNRCLLGKVGGRMALKIWLKDDENIA